MDIPTLSDRSVEEILSLLKPDSAIPRSPAWVGGNLRARRIFAQFLDRDLSRYADARQDPGDPVTSFMSPYLHFGQISPVTLAVGARDVGGPGAEAFLEELLVRRELGINFVHFNPQYDTFSALPVWAQQTLQRHASDPRPYLYTLQELEGAQTHDAYWNAAQREMVYTGRMQSYMRMYWGKKILEWSPSPPEAYRRALYLNNRYELDGRDPSGYAGVAWCFGKHDRPWKERQIFGTVRYMSAEGLERKYDIETYVHRQNRSRSLER
jgi:Deoxyribodipyrimidine photo-lyase type II (EC 4.1.99.3)